MGRGVVVQVAGYPYAVRLLYPPASVLLKCLNNEIREQQLKALKVRDDIDILVIGGGATGCGTVLSCIRNNVC